MPRVALHAGLIVSPAWQKTVTECAEEALSLDAVALSIEDR